MQISPSPVRFRNVPGNCAGWLVIVAVSGIIFSGAAPSQSVPPDYGPRSFTYLGSPVTIVWDSFGVPNVSSGSDPGAFFGWGYAMSVDRFFQMEMARREMLGLQAELLGNDVSSGRSPVQTDIDVRQLRVPHFLRRNHDALQARFPQHFVSLQAFSDGVNHYLSEKLGDPAGWETNLMFPTILPRVHPLFIKFPLSGSRFRPWTTLDCAAALAHVSDPHGANVFGQVQLLYAYRFLRTDDPRYELYYSGSEDPPPVLSHEEAIEDLLGTSRFDEAAVAVKQLDVPLSLQDEIFAYAQQHGWGSGTSAVNGMGSLPEVPTPRFSHGIAAAGTRINGNGGRAVVLAMPQLPATKMLVEGSVQGPGFSARGISFPGCPGFMVGFNRDVGWGITSAGGTAQIVYELRMGLDSSGQPDPGTYRYNNVKYDVVETTENVPVRNAPRELGWTDTTVLVRWAADILGPELPEGLPVVTTRVQGRDRNNDPIGPVAGFQYVILHPRYFSDAQDQQAATNTAIAYLDMLAATDVFGIKNAVLNYTNPACALYAGDKDGNVGYWYLKQLPLHSASTALAPLGLHGAMTLNNTTQLASEIIPLRFMPNAINPRHQLTAGVRSPMEHIVVCGNSAAVGAWYPLPVYGGLGDTLRSLRFWQLLRAYPSSGSGPGLPDDKFTAEQILGFHYDDVDPLNFSSVRAALHQRSAGHDTFTGDAERMLVRLNGDLWVTGGGHMHSVLALVGGVTQISDSLRNGLGYDNLTALLGQAEPAKCLLIKAIEELYAANPADPGDIFSQVAGNDPTVRLELKNFLAKSIGNGYSRAVWGRETGATVQTKEQLGPTPPAWPGQWQAAYTARSFNVKINNRVTVGARFLARYHDDLLGYGSLDPQHDIQTGLFHNPQDGVGGQANNFYSQWVHFRWHDTQGQPAWAVFNPGNSLHPDSPYFADSMTLWERDGLLFDLEVTRNDPTRYLRPAPLQ